MDTKKSALQTLKRTNRWVIEREVAKEWNISDHQARFALAAIYQEDPKVAMKKIGRFRFYGYRKNGEDPTEVLVRDAAHTLAVSEETIELEMNRRAWPFPLTIYRLMRLEKSIQEPTEKPPEFRPPLNAKPKMNAIGEPLVKGWPEKVREVDTVIEYQIKVEEAPERFLKYVPEGARAVVVRNHDLTLEEVKALKIPGAEISHDGRVNVDRIRDALKIKDEPCPEKSTVPAEKLESAKVITLDMPEKPAYQKRPEFDVHKWATDTASRVSVIDAKVKELLEERAELLRPFESVRGILEPLFEERP